MKTHYIKKIISEKSKLHLDKIYSDNIAIVTQKYIGKIFSQTNVKNGC